jgi:Transposase, Mutator family
MLTVVPGDGSGHEGGKDSSSLIDEIVREGARRMLAEALQAEVDAYIAAHAAERDEGGRRLVVRNGYHQPREVLTSAGAVEVTVPRVNDKRTDPATGERQRFSSAILPPWCRKTPKITEVLPLLYLHGLSSGDFVPALGQFLGSSAGLSPSVIIRLTETWRAEQRAFAARDLSGVDYVYLWADGIHVNIRLEEHKLCLLVMIGVRADGRKELIALADGYRESAESWADLLRDCARRGMRAPVLAVGDGALGFWNGLREVFPQAREGRCWYCKTANVLAALPKSAHPGGEEGPGGDLGRRGQTACPRGGEGVRVRLRREVPQGRREDHQRYGGAAGVLRLPVRALGASAHHEPDRVDLRHGQAPDQGHQGPRLAGRRAGHGVQADRVSARPLARRQRPPPRRARAGRSDLHQRQTRRTARRERRAGSSLKILIHRS